MRQDRRWVQRYWRPTAFAGSVLSSAFAGASLLVGVLGGVLAVTPTPAQASDAAGGSNLDTVVVTGSRQKRSAGTSSSPIDVINAEELQRSGAGNLTDALNELLPSFNLPAITGYDQSAIVRPANLRGLNGDQTLVLVNGKRRHASAIVNANAYVNRGSEPVDLNLIPFSAIDHVEVLRDGAAAQYGSDAIAGVINIILKADATDSEFSTKVGGYGWKDGLTTQSGISKGWALPRGGVLELTGEFFSQNHTDRSGQASGPFYYPLPDGSPDPREATTNPDKVVDGLPDTRTYNVGYNLNLPVGDGLKAYSFGTTTFRHSKGYEYFRYANDGAKDPTYDYDPTTGTYTQIYPDGYEPNEVIDEIDFGLTAGVKGNNLLGWAWDVSSTYGKDDDSISVVNTMNATLGPTSPHAFYAGSWISTELTNNFDLTRSFAIGLPKPLDVAMGLEYRNNSYALKPGEWGSYGTGSYTEVTGPDPSTGQPASDPYYPTPGAQSFPGFNPAIASHDYRDSYAAYLDFETQPIKKLDVGLAGRFEHYDDFGNTVTGKLSTRYEIAKGWAVRGTVSNGFRAPALGQSHYAATTTNFANGEAFQVGTFPVDSAEAKAFGAQALKPEKSTNYSVGFVATPIKNLDVTIDLYRIYVRNRILETGQIGAAQYPDVGDYLTGLLESAGLDPTSAAGTSVQYFTNGASTRTQGLDWVTSYKTNFKQYGSVRWSIEANWNQTTITGITPPPAALAPVAQAYPDFQLADVSTQGFLTVGTPRNKLILGAQYSKGPFRASLHETRYGHVVDTENAVYDGPIETVAPAWITDLDLSYEANQWLTVGLGADNLFNRYPNQTSADFQSFVGQGFGKYDGLTPYGYFGGFYYGRATIHF